MCLTFSGSGTWADCCFCISDLHHKNRCSRRVRIAYHCYSFFDVSNSKRYAVGTLQSLIHAARLS